MTARKAAAQEEAPATTKSPETAPVDVAAGDDLGYIGVKVDPYPNSAHSLESGPDAPPLHTPVTGQED